MVRPFSAGGAAPHGRTHTPNHLSEMLGKDGLVTKSRRRSCDGRHRTSRISADRLIMKKGGAAGEDTGAPRTNGGAGRNARALPFVRRRTGRCGKTGRAKPRRYAQLLGIDDAIAVAVE